MKGSYILNKKKKEYLQIHTIFEIISDPNTFSFFLSICYFLVSIKDLRESKRESEREYLGELRLEKKYKNNFNITELKNNKKKKLTWPKKQSSCYRGRGQFP